MVVVFDDVPHSYDFDFVGVPDLECFALWDLV